MKRKLHIERMIDLLCEIAVTRKIAKNTKKNNEYNKLEVACLTSNLLEEEVDDLPKDVRDNVYHDTVVSSAILRQMYRGKPTVHIIGDRFGSHLNRTNVDVPCSHLIKEMGSAYYIEFPDSVTFKTGGTNYYRTAMVVEAKSTDRSMGDKMLMFMFPDYSQLDDSSNTCTYYWMSVNEKYTISESIDGLEQYLGKEVPQHDKEALAFAAKCILYINSGEPDLINEAAKYPVTKNPKKIRNHWKKNYPFDITRVGYGFHGKTYSKDSTDVVGHYRWQPYGPNRELLKLIWIKEHERKYK